MQVVVLASGSQYRVQLMERLGIEFQTLSPDIDESANEAEPATALAQRLARAKAEAAASALTGLYTGGKPAPAAKEAYIVIGSDQVASSNDVTLGKPGTPEKACAQLALMCGQTVEFHTSLYMLDVRTGAHFSALDTTRVAVRHLDSASIARYVAADNPIDCAGSFKVESLGISLFESVTTEDPTALIGLPLIKVCEGLRILGVQIP